MLVHDDEINELARKMNGELRKQESMSKHTTYRIGGPAFLYALPSWKEDLQVILEFCNENTLPHFCIGGGSNLLVHDKGYPGMIIDLTSGFKQIEINENRVFAEAGISLTRFISECRRHGLKGVERLAGIPGTLGGALRMNAGAFGSEISQRLVSLTLFHEDGTIKELKAVELHFEYRESDLPPGSLILDATFELEKTTDTATLNQKSRETVQSRKEKQPVEYPSPGSIFKNPDEGSPAGKLIEDAGLKGMRAGGAVISEKHANFIINTGGATAEDVVHLIALAQKTVKEKFDVELELEIKLLGYDEWFI